MSSEANIIVAEGRREGEIGLKTYAGYLGAMPKPWVFLPLILILTAAANFTPILFKWMVGAWVEPTCGQVESSFGQYLCEKYFVYSDSFGLWVLFWVTIISIVLRAFGWFSFSLYLGLGGRNLHHQMAKSFSHVRVSFFDENPTGRLVRRFSGDYSQLNTQIPNYLGDIASSIFELALVVVVVFTQAPLASLAAIPSGLTYLRVGYLYRPASREVQRLTKVLESPIWSLYTEGCGGYQTIRAFDRTHGFSDRLSKMYDRLSFSILTQSRITRWLNVRLKFASETFSLAVVLYIAYACSFGEMSTGMAGFLMSLAIGLDMTMQWLTRSVSMLESSMVSVERILEYRNLPNEETTSGSVAPDEWPLEGAIEFKNFTMSYRPDLPLVLKGLSAQFPGGKRIGIVGRTGAGKSSLFQSLFRMVHVREGSILVDGKDISHYSVLKIRSIFGIIPQEPLLFSGTLRYNLDRTGRFSEEEIWTALKKVQLFDFVNSLPQKLSFMLTERGGNLSVGERQLICMARALLCDASIILMDEATASVDNETDVLIHKTVMQAFKGRTMLIIAHRLQTVRDCDFVAVIGDGQLISFGPPQEILASLTKGDLS